MQLSFTKLKGCAYDNYYLDCREIAPKKKQIPRNKAGPMITSIWTAVQPVCPQTLLRLHSGSLPGIFPWVRTASSASAPL